MVKERSEWSGVKEGSRRVTCADCGRTVTRSEVCSWRGALRCLTGVSCPHYRENPPKPLL